MAALRIVDPLPVIPLFCQQSSSIVVNIDVMKGSWKDLRAGIWVEDVSWRVPAPQEAAITGYISRPVRSISTWEAEQRTCFRIIRHVLTLLSSSWAFLLFIGDQQMNEICPIMYITYGICFSQYVMQLTRLLCKWTRGKEVWNDSEENKCKKWGYMYNGSDSGPFADDGNQDPDAVN